MLSDDASECISHPGSDSLSAPDDLCDLGCVFSYFTVLTPPSQPAAYLTHIGTGRNISGRNNICISISRKLSRLIHKDEKI